MENELNGVIYFCTSVEIFQSDEELLCGRIVKMAYPIMVRHNIL